MFDTFCYVKQDEIKNKYTPSNTVVKEKKESEFKKKLKREFKFSTFYALIMVLTLFQM